MARVWKSYSIWQVSYHVGLTLTHHNRCLPFMKSLECHHKSDNLYTCKSEAFHADQFRGFYKTAPYETRGENVKHCFISFDVESKVRYDSIWKISAWNKTLISILIEWWNTTKTLDLLKLLSEWNVSEHIKSNKLNNWSLLVISK